MEYTFIGRVNYEFIICQIARFAQIEVGAHTAVVARRWGDDVLVATVTYKRSGRGGRGRQRRARGGYKR